MQIAGASILVTGASGGLGGAIVRELSDRGARVVVTARRREVLEELAAATGAEVLVADLADRDDVAAVAERAAACDVLVANAGVGAEGPLTATSEEDFDRAVDVNLRSPMLLARRFTLDHLADERLGQIVFMGSLSGLAATTGTRLYNATKFGLRGFALSLRQELDGTGIGVTLVAPGFIRDAGMFADGGISVPPGTRTKAPGQVADAVVRAITRNPAEIYVAPTELRVLSTLSTLAPAISARVQKLIGVQGGAHG